ncbi:MAG: hypothetical protein H7A35_11435 [Planctomycetales bacterium]|nr:hypothetical protein [bacterium]UNM07472.1 MAG: hypothetical protein H7A35_11435 [Planctomycetales bacterium]
MFEDLVGNDSEVRIRTSFGSDVCGRLLEVNSGRRMFIVKAQDCEGSYHVPFDAVVCIRVDPINQLAGTA